VSGILFESILRPNDPQNGFHTAKTHSGPNQCARRFGKYAQLMAVGRTMENNEYGRYLLLIAEEGH
jgi:hypothetical protein